MEKSQDLSEEYVAALGNALYDAQIVEQTLRLYLVTAHDLIGTLVRNYIPYNYDTKRFRYMTMGQLIAEFERVTERKDTLIDALEAYNEVRIHLNQTVMTRNAVADDSGRPEATAEDITEIGEFGSEGFALRRQLYNRLQDLLVALKEATPKRRGRQE